MREVFNVINILIFNVLRNLKERCFKLFQDFLYILFIAILYLEDIIISKKFKNKKRFMKENQHYNSLAYKRRINN